MSNPEVDISFDTDSNVKKTKKQQLVKHRRKNWKKTDISEIEQGIDDLRQQQITGGARADKKDDELFFINKKKLDLNNEGEISNKRPKRLTLEEQMSNLNCYKNLKPDPNSLPIHDVRQLTKPDRFSKRQTSLNERKTKDMKRKLLAKSRENSYCAKLATELEEENDEEDFTIKKRKKRKTLTPEFKEDFKEKKLNVHLSGDFNKNIWTAQLANDGSTLPTVDRTNEFYLRGHKKIPFVKPTNPLYKKSCIAKIEAPHPGHSYNPDYDDHQALLLKAHTVELKKLQEEQKFIRRLRRNARKMTWQEMEKRWMDEMSVASLFESELPQDKVEEETSEGENHDSKREISISKRELRRRTEAVNNGRKTDTRAKRERKKLLEKIKIRQKENERQVKIQENEIYRLKALKKEVAEKMKKEDENTEKRKTEESLNHDFGQKRLGRLKFEDEELDLKLSSELTGNLRTLKPEGNIMRDRYKNLQKRNIIEPREKAKGKDKYSKKKFQKRNAYEVTHYIN